MPFDFHNKGRINNLIEELSDFRYRKLQEIPSFDWYSDSGDIGNRTPEGEPEKVAVGFRWKGWDRYNWLCTSIEIPDHMKQEDVLGLFDFGVPKGTGNNSHFESLLYVNGKPYQGVDGNHKEVFFDIKETGQKLDLKFRVWSGLNGGGAHKDMVMELVRAQFGVLDKATDEFYFLARTALETHELLDSNNEYKEWILNQLVKAFNFVDYTEPGSDDFYESIGKAHKYLDGKLTGQGKPDVTVSMLGHTHIDVAWLWRLRHTREKTARSFSTVNRLMNRHDEYIFLQSQAQLYDYMKEDYPDIYDMMKQRIAEGRWEPSGAMWVECDCNVASGEAIIRQILVGKNFFKNEFGYENKFLWLPDVFGYSWALPQILKKSGVDTFMTTKISWNDTNRLPYDTFLWRGMDGTDVTTHFITTTDQGDSYYTYNGNSRPYAVKGVWDNYRNKDLNKDLLISYGYGDGGGGPTRDMIKSIQAVEKMPGLPHVKTETATNYFERLNETIQNNPGDAYLPVWDGELYLEFHRGTYTSQAYNKKMNRRLEYRLRDAELLSVVASSQGAKAYPYDILLKAWKIVLCHQFHDILPGSSIHEVYEDSHVEYETALSYIEEAEGAAKDSLIETGKKGYSVFNTSNWVRSSYVRVEEKGAYEDEAGNSLPCAEIGRENVVYVADMAPMSFRTVYLKENTTAQKVAVKTKTSQADTKFYHVEWNKEGQLTGIYDKTAKREVLSKGKCGNVLQVMEDKPRCFDAWELEATIDNKKEEIRQCTGIEVEENELGIFVTATYTYHKSSISQIMKLYHNKRRIDFATIVDWQEHQKLLKTAFPVDIRATSARYDVQEGNIVRPITRNTSWEAAKFEVAAHKWADMWETGYGVALLNDCKYGYDIKEDTIRLTLIKSAIDPDYCADNGTHEFTYSLLPHSEEWYQAGIEEEAYDLNNQICAFQGVISSQKESLFSFSENNIVVDAVKKEENGEHIILRFHEYTGARKQIQIHSSLKVKEWCLCNLMEQPESAFTKEKITCFVNPYEIVSIMITI